MDRLIERARDTGGTVLVAELDGAVVAHLVLTYERMAPSSATKSATTPTSPTSTSALPSAAKASAPP